MSPKQPDSPSGAVNVQVQRGVGAGRDVVNSTIHVGLDANETGRLVRDAVHPILHLTRFEARTARAAENNSDASLLSAYRTDVVPLLGRDAILDDLKRWTASKRDISIRVLTGGAGRGKTRLALELARELGEHGWLAGFATDDALDRFRKQSRVAEWTWKTPTLVVIDYAAGRANQLHDWIGELVDRMSDKPLRLLLLERQANPEIGWLSTVLGSGADDRSRAARALLDPIEPIELPAIDDLVMRRAIFARLVARSKDSPIPFSGDDPEFDRRLRDEKWAGDPLFLMMAGLVAAETGAHNALALNRTDLTTMIAQRELDRIGRIAASRGVDATDQEHPGFATRHMAVLATLAQGLALADLRQLAQRELDLLGSTAGLNNVIDALRNALPRGGSAAVAPILPDIIGEAAILIWLGERGALSELGIEPLTCVRRVADTARSRVSQTLVRIAQDFAAAGRDEPVRWLKSLWRATDMDLDALIEITDELPLQTVALRELAADLALQVVNQLRGRFAELTGADADGRREGILAKSLLRLGTRLSDLGRREEALAAGQEAVDIIRRLAHSRPDEFLSDLARSLNNLGGLLSYLGRHEEALAASREAVDIYRRLAHSRPDAFLSGLAMSLSNAGIVLSNLRRHEEALAASQESVDIRRHLALSGPDTFLPDLALSLSNVGVDLSNLGRREAALAASREAVEIRRGLAQTHPDTFLPALAMSLNNLACDLSSLGKREEALAAGQESIEIRRRLAQSHPDAFLPDLALSLNNLSLRLSNLGRREEALAASQESVDIRRRLAQSRPDSFLPNLASSLNNLGNRLSNFGRHEEALAASQEAIDIYRSLAQGRPDAFLPELAKSISAHSDVLATLDRHEEAARAAADALRMLLPYVQRSLETYRGLARAIVADVKRYSDAAGLAHDATLLEQAAQLLPPDED
ncbi:tetratricopeptide repeat protein [Bradyrhizobium sp.]|uniref:tetratricopeptide repeat protein n=1 Tax=Bradyrhizobium sp. TaxID=376 RepID=UPI002BB48B46|nr:tetratricopeptide repeat protein [Bradyrhizobium sp.]HWX62296.1 tetratricopeptide repeat protein [Bradyrhizobium sp.]